MSTDSWESKLNTWSDLELKHVFYAYRKAKADCFFDHVVGAPLRFAAYENDIAGNLRALLERLRAGEVDQVLDGAKGGPRIVAKKLDKKRKSLADHLNRNPTSAADSAGSGEPHAFFSDATRAFKGLQSEFELTPEFRLVGDFEVEYHIVAALWVNQIGHKFDACMD